MSEPSKDSPKPLVFELLAEIATGPTARVELCRVKSPPKEKGKLTAVKRLHPHIAEDPQFQTMFIDEVWMTAALDHPNVVHVVGWGNDSEGTYLAVELVEGVSLARLMKTVFETREAFSERMVVFMGAQICAGLSAAHQLRGLSGESLGLVHRDLTPGNVLIGFDGRVKIADFGLAKAKQRVTKTLTGLLKGHPHYMAPEQATDAPIDARADLFSLGVLLFELFTGRHPWSGGSELEIFHVMAHEPPEDILSLRPKLDKELAMVVDRLLEKDPARRFGSADEVRAHLDRWLDTHGYKDDNAEAVARFVRRNAMRQQRWFERAVAGEFVAESVRAKARLLGTRGRNGPLDLRSAPQAARIPQPAALSSRRRAARKLIDDPTDETDRNPIEDRPSNETAETPDWGEEIPTQVQTNRQARDAVRSLLSSPTNPRPGALPTVTNMDALPSFADDESDGRTTTIKAKGAAMAYAVRMPSSSEDEVPTTPVGKLNLSKPLPRLPPPRERRDDLDEELDEDQEAGATRVDPLYAMEERANHKLDARAGVARSEQDVRAAAERLGRLAARMQTESERAQRLAAHRGLLADLARDSAAAAEEAVRQLSQRGLEEALRTLEEAHRLEDAVLRGDRQTSAVVAENAPQLVTERLVTERLRVVPTFATEPPRAETHGPILAGAAQGMVIGAPEPAPNLPSPFAHGGMPLHHSQALPTGERQSYLPPMPDPRREPTVPGVRFNVPRPPENTSLFSGEVFGVPVWVALAVAFLIALAVVIMVDVMLR